jgi:hypothetical protein
MINSLSKSLPDQLGSEGITVILTDGLRLSQDLLLIPSTQNKYFMLNINVEVNIATYIFLVNVILV